MYTRKNSKENEYTFEAKVREIKNHIPNGKFGNDLYTLKRQMENRFTCPDGKLFLRINNS